MLLSIIVVNYRSWDCLERCLESFPVPGPDGDREIVVVDNDSADGKFETFAGRFPEVRFIKNSGNHGYAHACNVGARAARGELLLFANPDLTAGPGQLEKLLDEKRAYPDIRILSASQVGKRGRPQKSFDSFPTLWTAIPGARALQRLVAPGRYPHPRRAHDRLIQPDWVAGSLMLMTADDLRRLGGWCEDFWMYSEDVDLCMRARKLGWRVALTPRATFVHRHGGTTRANLATESIARFESLVSRHVFISRHYRGLRGSVFHGVLAANKIVLQGIAGLVNLLTFGTVRPLRVRGRVWLSLVGYYARRLGGGDWLGPRAVRSDAPTENSEVTSEV
ncbi:MAG: glycosyltransferase [Acidobacteria bacterium]|nr:glycosyltransferase [Acidobacteriota bacterium]NIM60328.1 glycosyltransferase [Acidobacteriota bacterium]NIO60329.1 glycosyltransferase [Acidobacteriota bacterium]NIQ31384.1 glycosyltransferase [Acidobacteriota bacterium]NIQ86610.1 glycosyltransferase [Acidobacteriota bacterium]